MKIIDGLVLKEPLGLLLQLTPMGHDKVHQHVILAITTNRQQTTSLLFRHGAIAFVSLAVLVDVDRPGASVWGHAEERVVGDEEDCFTHLAILEAPSAWETAATVDYLGDCHVWIHDQWGGEWCQLYHSGRLQFDASGTILIDGTMNARYEVYGCGDLHNRVI